MGKIAERNSLRKLLAAAQAEGKKVVFTNGCFDVLHLGHIDYLEKAKELGDLLVVGLNTDASITRLKGATRPLYKETERTRLVAALGAVDYVTLFDEDDPRALIELLQPDILVKGGDYQINEILGRETVLSRGGEVKTIPLVAGHSTSKLIEIILERFSG